MNCKICNKKFSSTHHANTICSNECRIVSRKKTNSKFNNRHIKKPCNLNSFELIEGEFFKDIDENYKISNKGRVYSRKKQGFLKLNLGKNGYYSVGIKRKHKLLHRLIALHFIPNPENKPCIDHIDRNRKNNNIENLRWVTYKENNYNKNIIKKGCIVKTKDKNTFNNKTVIYIGYRFTWYEEGNRKSKRFKTEEEALNYQKLIYGNS